MKFWRTGLRDNNYLFAMYMYLKTLCLPRCFTPLCMFSFSVK